MRKLFYSLILVCVCEVSQAQTNWQVEKGTVMDSLFQKLAGQIYVGETSNKVFYQKDTLCNVEGHVFGCKITKSKIYGPVSIRGTLTQLLLSVDQITQKCVKLDTKGDIKDKNGEIRFALGFSPTHTNILNSGNLDSGKPINNYRLSVSTWEQTNIAPGKITVRVIVSRVRFAEEIWTLQWDRGMTINIVQALELDNFDGSTTLYTYDELKNKTTKIIKKQGKI